MTVRRLIARCVIVSPGQVLFQLVTREVVALLMLVSLCRLRLLPRELGLAARRARSNDAERDLALYGVCSSELGGSEQERVPAERGALVLVAPK